jgi:lipoyl synthase
LRRRFSAGGASKKVREIIDALDLNTVCSSADCPNMGECFARRTATFMILGDRCTRTCRFCAVQSEEPRAVREDEPEAVAEACGLLGLRHVVLTSVTRDDLPDGGAAHFARTCRAVRARLPESTIELLTPDFAGSHEAIASVIEACPDVFNHNVETVPRLYPLVRPEAQYERSLDVLDYARRESLARGMEVRTKSGIMVGLGETRQELLEVMGDLVGAGCDILTVGQYLAPSAEHQPVARYVEPLEFEEIEAEARAIGFRAVASGPFVRSSYNAESVYRDGYCE